MSGHMYGAIPRTTETELETEPKTEPETESETDTDTETENGTFNIRDFGLSTRMSILKTTYIVLAVIFFFGS